MANEFLISKWKLWYKSLDVNHDGKLSMEDVVLSRNKFSDLHHLDKEQQETAKEGFTQWWDEFVFRGRKGDISEQEFVDSLNAEFNTDKDKFRQEMSRCFELVFTAVDVNHDSSISKEEFLIAFKTYGHENAAKDDTFFAAYNPVDGLIPFRVIVDSWIDFVTGTDESKINNVKVAFEADGFD